MTPHAVIAATAAAAAIAVAASWPRRRGARRLPQRSSALGAGPQPARRRRTIALAVGVGAVAALVVGPAITVLGAITAGGLAVSRRRSAAAKARLVVESTMPDAIELMVMCLHAGLTPTQAVGELARLAPAPVRPGFGAVEQRLHRGTGFADALPELSAHCGPSALALVTALGTAVRDGLALAPVLDRLADEANAGRRRAGEAAARRLPVRLSFPLVVCTLPSFVLLAIAPAVLGALSTVRGATP